MNPWLVLVVAAGAVPLGVAIAAGLLHLAWCAEEDNRRRRARRRGGLLDLRRLA